MGMFAALIQRPSHRAATLSKARLKQTQFRFTQKAHWRNGMVTNDEIRTLIETLRDIGDHARFEPHMHHESANMLAALLAEREWRPIAEAPDEIEILVYFGPRTGVKSAKNTDLYDDGVMHWCVHDEKHGPYAVRGYSEPFPTQWRPLPAPPEKA
jgi:hypothetical protein